MDKTFSKTGEYLFYSNGKKTHILDRDHVPNQLFIYDCAALAFHKALLGISELSAIESVSSASTAGGLRISKSILTYYIVYHTISVVMLLDEKFEITIKKDLENGKVPLEVSVEELNNNDESPNQWLRGKELEKDLASNITHKEINDYCAELRVRKENNGYLLEPLEIIYDNFIKHDKTQNSSLKCLYEKICYIRDRTVYRPTCVIDDKTGGKIQTSKYVRKEIDYLPNSEELLSICTKAYKSIVDISYDNDIDEQIRSKYNNFLISLWYSPIREDREHLSNIGFSEENIDYMEYKNTDEFCLCSYICQLTELASSDRCIRDIENIWIPLRALYENAHRRYHNDANNKDHNICIV